MQGRTAPKHRTYSAATVVSGVFKAFTWLTLLGGIGSAVGTAETLHHNGTSSGEIAGTVVGIIFGSILIAASLAFFAYVLDLLIGIEWNTYLTKSAGGQQFNGSVVPPPPVAVTAQTTVPHGPGSYVDPFGTPGVRY